MHGKTSPKIHSHLAVIILYKYVILISVLPRPRLYTTKPNDNVNFHSKSHSPTPSTVSPSGSSKKWQSIHICESEMVCVKQLFDPLNLLLLNHPFFFSLFFVLADHAQTIKVSLNDK